MIKSPCDTSWKSMLSDRSAQGEGSESFLINIARGFIKGPSSGELTGCEDHFSHLVWPSSRQFYLKRSSTQTSSPAAVTGWIPLARNMVESRPKMYINSNVLCIRNSLRDYFVVTFNIHVLLLQNHWKIFNFLYVLKTVWKTVWPSFNLILQQDYWFTIKFSNFQWEQHVCVPRTSYPEDLWPNNTLTLHQAAVGAGQGGVWIDRGAGKDRIFQLWSRA